jgi:hypothetical protein
MAIGGPRALGEVAVGEVAGAPARAPPRFEDVPVALVATRRVIAQQ